MSFKIGDPSLTSSGFKFWDSVHYQYSCTKKFDFAPPEIPGVSTHEPVFNNKWPTTLISSEPAYF
jgi:hypothetical protein